jgi:hypothetical protein
MPQVQLRLSLAGRAISILQLVIMDGAYPIVEKLSSHNRDCRRKQTNRAHDSAFASTQPAGNLATQRLLRSGVIRPQLAVSQPGDSYEQEADRVADHVMGMTEPTVQLTCAACKTGATTCPSCQKKNSLLQRKAGQGNSSPEKHHSTEDFISGFGAGRLLDSGTRDFFEQRFAADLTNVRVHVDNHAAELAQSINALAYTLGRDVVFAPGQYAPETYQGRRLIAHELAHVLQQNHGVIQRFVTGRGTSQSNSCSGWEQDPESFSIHVARHFVATQVNPALAGKPRSVTCESDHDCKVTFGDDLVIDVYWNKDTRRVGAGRWTDQGRQFCAFDYSCDSTGQLILSVVKCYGTPKP